jgi:hypothetical protein
MSTIPDLKATPGDTPLHPDDAAELIPNPRDENRT